ncbi:caveolin-3-like [Acropora millepora]|uniref:caveolin-3-like n=1 Tax=Acropora millepora TaxID=45264 RepID=UPI0010FC6A68|nr:caveolin-3-like [Acropora millepora]
MSGDELRDVEVQIRGDDMEAKNGQQISLSDRDPTAMNDHVKVFFQDVFAEPEGSYSIDGVWRTSFTAFVNTKYWCYRIITAVLGIPTAVLCGMYFACLSFDYIWCVMPCLRAYIIELQCLGKIFGLCLRTFCDPFFESVSRIFSGIKVMSQKA